MLLHHRKSIFRLGHSNQQSRTIIAIAAIVVLLVSCGIIGNILRGSELTPTSVSNSPRILAAIALSYEFEYQEKDDRGYFAFINDDGSYTLVPNAGMDSKTKQSMIWNNSGLFAIDGTNDYIFSTKGDLSAPKTLPSPKDGFLNALIPTNHGESKAMIIDVGFPTQSEQTTTRQYEYQFIYDDGNTSISADFSIDESSTGHASLYAACGDDLFTIAGEAPNNTRISTLRHLTSLDSLINRVVSQTQNPLGLTEFAQTISPCISNRIYSIALEHPSEIYHTTSGIGNIDMANSAYPSVEEWDSSTGARQSIPLYNVSGEKLDDFQERIVNASYLGSPVQGNRFFWLSGRNELMATNLSSGVTDVLNDEHKFTEPGHASALYAFIDSERTTALTCPIGKKGECFITSYCNKDGHVEKHLAIPGLSSQLSLHLMPQGFAINPHYDWSMLA